MIARSWWWFRKEVRESRVLWIGAMGAMVFLSVLWTFLLRRKLDVIDPGFYAMTAVQIGIGIAILGFAGEVFSAERRRNRWAHLQRLPGAMLPALVGKSCFALAVTLFLPIFFVACMAGSIAAFGHADIAAQILGTFALVLLHLGDASFWLASAVCLTIWIALFATWLPKPGASILGAILLLAAVLTGPFEFYRRHAVLIEWPWALTRMASFLAVLGALALVAAFLRGLRHGNRSLRAVLASVLVLVPGLALGAGYGAWKWDRWSAFDPRDRDVRPSGVIASSDGKSLYVRMQRERLGGRPNQHHAERTWKLDLETGDWSRPFEGFDRIESATWWLQDSMRPVSLLESWEQPLSWGKDEAKPLITYLDACTGEVVKTLVYDTVVPELEAQILEAAFRSTDVRDREGRRSVLYRCRIHKEDGSVQLLAQDPKLGDWTRSTASPPNGWPIPGGWRRWLPNRIGSDMRIAPDGSVFVFPDSKDRTFLSPSADLQWKKGKGAEDDDTAVARWWLVEAPPSVREDAREVPGVFWLDREDLVDREAVNAPSTKDAVCFVEDEHHVLIRDTDTNLAWWDPSTGVRSQIQWSGAKPSEPFSDRTPRVQSVGDGHYLVSWASRSSKDGRFAWRYQNAWLDADAGTIQRISNELDGLESLGSLVAVLDGPRFVFLGWHRITIRDLDGITREYGD